MCLPPGCLFHWKITEILGRQQQPLAFGSINQPANKTISQISNDAYFISVI